jgi:protein-S-isoprenylcysteine O-methyltransferase Ste14
MRGSIRIVVGMLIAFGAVGHLDYDPDASELLQTLIATAGLVLAAWGVRDMNRNA